MNTEQIDLIHQYLDDRLAAADVPALQALLRESAEARRLLRSLATIDAKLTELASVQTANAIELPSRQLTASRASSAWRMLTGLALGLLLGTVFSTMAYAVPRWLDQSLVPTLILAESFESSAAPRVNGLQAEPNLWSGDFTAITTSEQGITPATGKQMLRVLRADYDGKPNSAESYCGDLYRLIDLRPYRQQIATGTAMLQLSTSFNAISFPQAEQYCAAVAVHALPADLAASPESLSGQPLVNGSLAMARQTCRRLDSNPGTWQQVKFSLNLPAESEFLLVHVSMNHLPKFQRRISFDGHYVDDIRISLTTRN